MSSRPGIEKGHARAPLAIVGLGHVLPGGSSPDAFWQAVVRGQRLFGRVPGERWDEALYGDPACAGNDRLPPVPAAFVRDFQFDWRRFRMAPRVAAELNPMHLMLIHAAADALADAGSALDGQRIGFVLGTSGLGFKGDYGLRVRARDFLACADTALAAAGASGELRAAIADRARAGVDERLAPILEDNVLMAVASVAQGRVMNMFSLRGPHFAVDAGGASALAALDAAWDLLEAGECDAFLVGGASPWLYPAEMAAWRKAGYLAESPPCPFDRDAAGTLLGEGVVLFLVQPLARARAEGRRIHAVLRGLAGGFGGRHRRVAAPSVETCVRAMQRAHREAGAAAERIDYVECHAAGVGREDEDEVRALSSVFGARSRTLWLGSVKANVGHLQGAAGSAGLLKTVLALARRTIPPQPGVTSPLAELEGNPRLRVASAPLPWPEARAGAPAAAAVTACAAAGMAYHLVLEADDGAPGPAQGGVTVSARGRAVAITGLGAVLPDAPDVATFWAHTLGGHDAVREVPPTRFDVNHYCDPDRQDKASTYSKLGAFVPDMRCDPARYGVLPRSLPHIDRAQLLGLDAALEAAADAAPVLARVAPERIAVIMADAPQREREVETAGRVDAARLLAALADALDACGVGSDVGPGARNDVLASVRRDFCAVYTPLTEDSLLGFHGSAVAGRIAARLGAAGPVFNVESACASSLVAVALASEGLARGAYDVAVIGGVSASMSPEVLMSVCAFNGISAQGIFPFDERASGFIVGEGAAVLVLVRLEDAQRAGDRVYAVVQSYGCSSDGEGRSVFPPNPRGQAESCRRALDKGGLAPADIDYIECHGTGTPVGDLSELRAYAAVYGGHGKPHPLWLGSAKSMIGHINAGAGAAGLMRTALSLHHRQLPPTLHSERPSALLPFGDGPFEVNRQARPWPARPDGAARNAAVSAFGLGGTNFHLVVAEHVPAPGAVPERDAGFPLIDRHERMGPHAHRFTRPMSMDRDRYLHDHLVGGVPVVPGAFGCELIAQAASQATPGWHVIGLEDVQFLQLLRVPPDESVEVDVQARCSTPRDGRVVVEVDVGSWFSPRGARQRLRRSHFQGRAILAERVPPAAMVAPALLDGVRVWTGRDYAPLYEKHVYSTLGPRFRAVREARVLDHESILARLETPPDDDLFAGNRQPRLMLGPIMIDNYFQVAGTIGVHHNRQFPLPVGVTRIQLWSRPVAGDTVWVHSRISRDDGESLWYGITVFDGHGRVHAQMEDMQTRNFLPFEGPDLVHFYQTLVGRLP